VVVSVPVSVRNHGAASLILRLIGGRWDRGAVRCAE
jgi:hypothetical protein